MDDGSEGTDAEFPSAQFSADELKLDPKAKAQTVNEDKLLEEPRAEWMDSDDEWECGWWMVSRRRGLDDLEQLNLDLCEEDFQKLRKPEPLVPAWQWFDNETEQLDCALDLDQAIDKYNNTTINDIGWKADRISDVNVPDRICLAAHENYLSGQSLDTHLFQGQSWDTYFE